MKKSLKNIGLPIAAFGFGGIVFGGIVYFLVANKIFQNQSPTSVYPLPTATKLYTNDQWQFSLLYPAELDDIQEGSDSVAFGMKNDSGLSGYAIRVEPTSFGSTEAWLAAQPKGSTSSEGYELVSWLTLPSSSMRTAIVAEYVVYDRDQNRQPLYRKGLYAVHVEHGRMYLFPFGSSVQFDTDEVPEVSALPLNFLLSFKPYVER